MTQFAKNRSQPRRAGAGRYTREQRGAARPGDSRSRWGRWALPVVALTAVLMGGLVVTSDFVLGGAGAAKQKATTSSPHGVARGTPSPTPRAPSEPVPTGTFATRVYTDQGGNHMTYYLYGPSGYTPAGKFPLVLVLHGGGERADPSLSAAQNRDVLLRQAYVQAFTADSTQGHWPCFVVVPQSTISQRWVNVPTSISSYTLAAQPALALMLAMGIVQHLQQEYPEIDSTRMYIGGISSGAFGTWEALERWPHTFAAAFPIAGAGDPQAAAALVDVAIWAFHGSGDGLVPVQGSRLMVQAVDAAGGTVCYTEYPGAAHDIWVSERPLYDPTVLRWLFSQRRTTNGSTSRLDCQGHLERYS